MSVPPVRTKLASFVLAGAIAGMAGGLYAVLLGAVAFHTYDPSYGLVVFSMAVIGGLGSISGVLMGVALIEVLSYSFPKYQLVFTGVGLLLVLLFLPGGLAEGVQGIRDRLLRRVAERRQILVPSLVADRRVELVEHAPGGDGHPGARAERGGRRGGCRPRPVALRPGAPRPRDEDTAPVPLVSSSGPSGPSASIGARRTHPGQPGGVVVPAGRGLLRTGADPLRRRPRRARGRDRGAARHQRRRQVHPVEGRQRSGQGGRRCGVARRRGHHRRSRRRPWPGAGSHSCPAAAASSPPSRWTRTCASAPG